MLFGWMHDEIGPGDRLMGDIGNRLGFLCGGGYDSWLVLRIFAPNSNFRLGRRVELWKFDRRWGGDGKEKIAR